MSHLPRFINIVALKRDNYADDVPDTMLPVAAHRVDAV